MRNLENAPRRVHVKFLTPVLNIPRPTSSSPPLVTRSF